MQAHWSSKQEKDPSRLNRPSLLRGEVDPPEELQLDPTKARSSASNVAWRNDLGGSRGVTKAEKRQDEEELILEPRGAREGHVAQSASWQKQSSGECE